MNDLLISIVIATKNAEPFLAQALDSVAAQDYRNFETIVVDGDSTDATKPIARSYPQTMVLDQGGTGLPHAWNVGIRAARGPLIAFLDSDDVWSPHKLSSQAQRLLSDPEADYVVGRVQFFADENRPLPRGFKPQLLEGSHVAYMPGASLIRRGVFDKIGAFEEQWQVASDLVWFARLRKSGLKGAVIDDIVLRKRIHSSNLSNVAATTPVYRQELLAFAKDELLRRRKASSRDVIDKDGFDNGGPAEA